MTKLKQVSSEFDALYSGENSPWVGGGGGYGTSQAVRGALLPENWEKHGLCRVLVGARRKRGVIG